MGLSISLLRIALRRLGGCFRSGVLSRLAALLIIVAVAFSPSAWSFSHDAVAFSTIVTHHLDEIHDHGHAHADDGSIVVDVERHAFKSHAHNPNDHDHIVVFLPPPPPQCDHPAIAKAWTLPPQPATQNTFRRHDRPPSA